MKKTTLAMTIIIVAILLAGSSKSSLQSNTSQTPPRPQKNYGKIPLYFEKNEGQADPQIDFISRGQGYGFYTKATESFFNVENNLLTMKLENANDKAKAHGLDQQMAKVNYLSGNDPKAWKTGITTYAKVQYDHVYPGIDVIYYGNQKKIEYDFVVAPHADYSQIRLKFKGAQKMALNEKGDLVLTLKEGTELTQQKPEIYQEHNHQRQKVEGSYVLKGKNEVAFTVAAYDSERPLIIDPTLVYSTYLGGTRDEIGRGIAVGATGSAYVAGVTSSLDFPISSANVLQPNSVGGDMFVSKLSSDGSSLIYSTYMGSHSGSVVMGIAVDPAGSAYVTGWTDSDDFPTTSNAFQVNFGGSRDAFVVKLNPGGSALIYSSYLGGPDRDLGFGIAVDTTGSAYITGFTESADFPTHNAFQANFGSAHNYFADGFNGDAFVSKFSSDGSSLIYSSYLGGSSNDCGKGIAVDSTGLAYVIGHTESADFPTRNPYQTSLSSVGSPDIFVTQISADGSSLKFSSYLGGSNDDWAGGIAVDSTGLVYVAGHTESADFPTTGNAYQTSFSASGSGTLGDVFVAKLNPRVSSLLYATYLGGREYESGAGIVVDSAGSAYVTGWTISPDFPTTSDAPQGHPGRDCVSLPSAHCMDSFVTQISPDGSSVVYSSYLGGSHDDEALGIALDLAGSVYVTGWTKSPDFLITDNAYQVDLNLTATNNSTIGNLALDYLKTDAFVLKFAASCGEAKTKEICDKMDNDCDGQIDEGFHWAGKQCYKMTFEPNPLLPGVAANPEEDVEETPSETENCPQNDVGPNHDSNQASPAQDDLPTESSNTTENENRQESSEETESPEQIEAPSPAVQSQASEQAQIENKNEISTVSDESAATISHAILGGGCSLNRGAIRTNNLAGSLLLFLVILGLLQSKRLKGEI